MTEGAGSTVPRRMLGRELRRLRESAGITVAQACRAIEVSPQTMWRLEGGQGVKLKDIYIKALCDLYLAGETDTAALTGLVQESKRTGWWHAYGDVVPADFDLYLGLEQAARKLTMSSPDLLPGLLQTAEYRRALIWATYPAMPTEEVERRIEVFSKRKVRLQEPPDRFGLTVYLGEAALRSRVGGAAVIAGQLRHIAEIATLPAVTIRVVPLSTENPLSLIARSFTLMEFSAHPMSRLTEPPTVYVEGYTGALYLNKPSEIAAYRAACKGIRAAALNEQDTRRLILTLAKEHDA